MQITKAKVVADYIVRFTLSNGRDVERDFSLVHGPVFDPIWEDPNKFRRVRVVHGVPTWPGHVDFCPDTVLRGGLRGRIPTKAIIGPQGTLLSAKGVTHL